MPYSLFEPSIVRLSGRPRPEPNERAAVALPRRYGKGRPYADDAVEAVRALIEETTLTYGEIAARTGASPASISRWMQAGGWKRPLFAPRSMLTVPTPRATAYNKHRLLAAACGRSPSATCASWKRRRASISTSSGTRWSSPGWRSLRR